MRESFMGKVVQRHSPPEVTNAATDLGKKIVEEATPMGQSSVFKEIGRGVDAIGRMIGGKKEKPPVKGNRDPDQQIDDLMKQKGAKHQYSK